MTAPIVNKEIVMLHPTRMMIQSCIDSLRDGYRQIYNDQMPEYLDLLEWSAPIALAKLTSSNAPYHNLEHTVLVLEAGLEIISGKQAQEGTVSCQDWMQFILALMCHDIGYAKDICQADQPAAQIYTSGLQGETVTLPPNATSASLAPYHVDRGKQFVQETFANQPLVDVAAIQQMIELTRFPVPAQALYQETNSYAGLVRAADLIGQLSDPNYLDKLPALFCELVEVGNHKTFGYSRPEDLRSSYPRFFRQVVVPYIRDGMRYVASSRHGRYILTHLYANVRQVERDQQRQMDCDAGLDRTQASDPEVSINRDRIFWGSLTDSQDEQGNVRALSTKPQVLVSDYHPSRY